MEGMTPTDQEMAEAVVDGLAGRRYFRYITNELHWVVEAEFAAKVIVYHAPAGVEIKNGTVTIDFINKAVAEGHWQEVERPEWLHDAN